MTPCAALPVSPTAHTSRSEVALTEYRQCMIQFAGGLGLGVCCQRWPFQCAISVRLPEAPELQPAAQTSAGEIAAMPHRVLPTLPGFGLSTRCQAVPLQ